MQGPAKVGQLRGRHQWGPRMKRQERLIGVEMICLPGVKFTVSTSKEEVRSPSLWSCCFDVSMLVR